MHFFHRILQASIVWDLATLAAARSDRRESNGLAITPPMGWNSYNHYSCFPTEAIIQSNAQALVDLGLNTLGYHYVTTDCGWATPSRLANGSITWNTELFPSGFIALGQFLHARGLGFGVYSDGGIQMCTEDNIVAAGSLGHETQDAETFASWGADMLKYDNCFSDAATGFPNVNYAPSTSPSIRYQNMSTALKATGRPILFAVCEWGVDFPALWAPALGNTFRMTNDINPVWPTIWRQLNQAVPQTSFVGPGGWMDMDMLEVGNNVFTTPEEQTHFSMWAILKSPLIIGAALKDTTTSISAASLAILKNPSVIGYNQDSLGVAASFRRRYTAEGYEVWAGPLSSGRTVAALINWQNTARSLTLELSDVGLASASSLHDIWGGTVLTSKVTSYTATVAAHGIMLVELGSTTPAPAQPTGTYFPSTAFTITNPPGITTDHVTCTTGFCLPVGAKIGNIVPTSVVSISIPRTASSTAGSKLVLVDYCNNDIAFQSAFTTGTNTRNLTLAVNGVVTRIEVPLSGRHSELFGPTLGWEDTATFPVELPGWGAGAGADTLVVSNVNGNEGVQMFGADFVGLRVIG